MRTKLFLEGDVMYSGYPMMNYQQPRTDIGQVSSEQEAVNAYVAAGCSKIMFTPDDKTVYVKCVSMNGQTTLDIFDKRAIRPQNCDPAYVTHDELAEILKGLKSPKNAVKEVVEE